VAARRLPAFFVLGVLLAAGPVRAAAQDPTPAPPIGASPLRYPYEFASSSVPMLRNAQLFSAAGALADRAIGTAIERATGHLFEKRGWKGVAARISRLYFVDMPIASLAQVYNHEYGHITRNPWGLRHFVHVDRWPWPFPIAGPRIDGDWSSSGVGVFDTRTLGSIAGGSEASHVLADTLIGRAYAADRVSYFDVLLYAYGKLDPSAYAIAYSGPSRPNTDPWAYAQALAYVRSRPFGPWPEDAGNLFGSVRSAAWLNLLDYALIANVEGVIADYIVAGRQVVRPRWLNAGPVRLVPGFNYTPTPRGQQYRINCRIGRRTATGNVYVRWTQSLKNDSVDERARQFDQMMAKHGWQTPIAVPSLVPLLGLGSEWRWASDHTVAPSLAADAWRDIDKHFGGRAELAVTYRQAWLGETRAVRFGVGGKSAGYLMGFPEQRGFYVSAALLAEF
jgi:hypothetical protein